MTRPPLRWRPPAHRWAGKWHEAATAVAVGSLRSRSRRRVFHSIATGADHQEQLPYNHEVVQVSTHPTRRDGYSCTRHVAGGVDLKQLRNGRIRGWRGRTAACGPSATTSDYMDWPRLSTACAASTAPVMLWPANQPGRRAVSRGTARRAGSD